jgi:GT2 family glycosyltransferase
VFRHLADGGFSPVVVSTPPPWSPGKARNRGAWLALGEVLVFNDADTIVPHEQIREAARLAAEQPGLVYGYSLYLSLAEGAEPVSGKVEREIVNSPSMGCAAISRECFERLGGFDESYQGWGYEDVDFAVRAAELWPLRRVEGPAYHLWHGGRRLDDAPDDSDPFEVAANYQLWKRTRSTA